MTGAKIVIESLIDQGVECVFGYPGGSVLDIFDELYKASDRIKQYMTSHEQGACHAADGYARASGKVGVVIATSGPGATNLVTGIATAYMDSIPLVAITGNVGVPLLGRDSFQEVDITGITMPVTKHNYIVKDIKDLAPTISEAFRLAKSGRPGPVLVDIPKNIQQLECDYLPSKTTAATTKSVCNGITCDDTKTVAALIKNASRPLLYIGGGVITGNATQEVMDLAYAIKSPVASSLMGLGGYPSSDPLSIGLIGMHGHKGVMKAVGECDTLIVLGARFSDRVAGDRNNFAPKAKIIHIDIDAAEIGKNVIPHANIIGDIKTVLTKLLKELAPAKKTKITSHWASNICPPAYGDKEPSMTPLDPRHIIRTVAAQSPDTRVIATDVGQHQMWTAQSYPFSKPRTFVSSGGLGTMGFGLGAALGAAIALNDSSVLFTGDGSFHMNLNELATISRYNIPVKIFLLNNSVLGMVRQWQKLFYSKRYSSTIPDFPTKHDLLAQAFGVKYLSIESNDKVIETVGQALKHTGPVLVECKISCDDNVLPMIPPGKSADSIIEVIDN